MNIVTELASQISTTMIRKNITMAALVEKTKLPEEHLIKILNAEVNYDVHTLATIADALGVRFILSRL